MAIWITLALMTGAAVLLLLWPLARHAAAAAPSVAGDADDIAFYTAQLSEIERDAKAGLIGEAEAEIARAEAARRLLRASPVGAATQSGAVSAPNLRRKLASLVALAAVPLIALPMYLKYGAPALPDLPLAERRVADPAKVDVAEAVARIEAHLAKNPDDGRGYEVVAPVYFRMDRFGDAARAYAHAIRLLGETSARLSSLAESEVALAGGIVTPSAKAAFQRALALEPGHVKSRYYIALAMEQDGDRPAAIAAFEAMLADAPADAPWLAPVRERIAGLKGVPAGGDAIASLPAQERDAAIRSMVDGLEIRLNDKGGTVEEWSRLIRAMTVLGDRERAQKAVTAARGNLGADAAALAVIEALAKELGLQS